MRPLTLYLSPPALDWAIRRVLTTCGKEVVVVTGVVLASTRHPGETPGPNDVSTSEGTHVKGAGGHGAQARRQEARRHAAGDKEHVTEGTMTVR